MSGTHNRHLPLNPWHLAAGAVLGTLRTGQLQVTLPDGAVHVFAGRTPGPDASMHIRDASVPRRLVTGASLALAETYIAGGWDTPDLDAVLRLGQANLSAGWIARLPSPRLPFERLRHLRRDNDPDGGSRRNVTYHYDLGNDFYELWLDQTMTYSAACFADGPTPPHGECPDALEVAQRRKWDRILELLQPGSRDHLLEIGCGWGGFALHAARTTGCRVTGITLSEEQAALARERVAKEDLLGRVDIRVEDYRTVSGRFSGIVSIEMFEAVGEKWWPTFFRQVSDALEPGRAAALQVITIGEEYFEAYRKRVDFIQRYVFPGGMLPSPSAFREAAQSQGLRVGEPVFFGLDYAKTLAEWAHRFESVLPDVRGLGFDDRFIRMWRYYLAYCRTGFEHGQIDVMQVRLEA